MKIFVFTILFILFLSNVPAHGQVNDYRYKRKLTGVTELWHSIDIPDEMFSKLNRNFSDIRVFGFTHSGDTLEAPYLMKLSTGQSILKDVEFTLLNKSYNANGYFYTFEVPAKEPVNQIELDFEQTNFHWKIKLEGTQDQQEWFTILDDYRILSINNTYTYYNFSTLVFPDTKYNYYRLCVKSHDDPLFVDALINLNSSVSAKYNDFNILSMIVKEDKERKQTIVDLELENSVPVSFVKIYAHNGFDFYRHVYIRSLTDSIYTDKGYIHNYTNISSGILSSVDNSGFVVKNEIVKNLRVIIDNYDSHPLVVDSIVVKGYKHQLVTRFTPDADYYICYGNENASHPIYDIERFAESIPHELSIVNMGEELLFNEKVTDDQQPLFVNKIWLWLVIIFIIVILGWFTFGMIKKSNYDAPNDDIEKI